MCVVLCVCVCVCVSDLRNVEQDELVKLAKQAAEGKENIRSLHEEPFADMPFIAREQELDELVRNLANVHDKLRSGDPMDKPYFFAIEYAIISGAGKSRWGFRLCKEIATKLSCDVRMVAVNFNGGSGGGSDCSSVSGKNTSASAAASRLLLSRGLSSRYDVAYGLFL